MNFFLKIIFLILLISSQLFSQTDHDTSKTLSNKKITSSDKNQLNAKSNILDMERLNRLEIRQDIFKVPLNLKIYQKIFADEKIEFYIPSQEELHSGLSNYELMIFEQNKSLTQKMLSDIYGKDIINLKKILTDLGITKDQIILVAAILKFFFYTPIL